MDETVRTAGQADDSSVWKDALRIEGFVFGREIYEVFLLLDYMSGKWDRAQCAKLGIEPEELIRTVCEIGITPATLPAERTRQAIELMRVKDALTTVALPATSVTVAFSALVIGEGDRRLPGSAPRRFWWSLLSKIRHRSGLRHERSGSEDVWTEPTRATLARYAHPGLIVSAIMFQRRMLFISVLLVTILVSSFGLSFHVAEGAISLQQLAAVQTRLDALNVQVNIAELRSRSVEGLHGQPTGAEKPADRFVPFCRNLGATSSLHFRTAEEYQLCTQLDALRIERRLIRQNLRRWFATTYILAGPLTGNTEYSEQSRAGIEERAAVLSAVMQATIVPLMYGTLGAGVALVRRLRERIVENMLAPQDATLAIMQLGLGGAIGICIGMFTNSPGPSANDNQGLLQSLALSNAAFSFIAGFALEGVFRSLELVAEKIFGANGDQTKSLGSKTTKS